jgi:hypothetical protein
MNVVADLFLGLFLVSSGLTAILPTLDREAEGKPLKPDAFQNDYR